MKTYEFTPAHAAANAWEQFLDSVRADVPGFARAAVERTRREVFHLTEKATPSQPSPLATSIMDCKLGPGTTRALARAFEIACGGCGREGLAEEVGTLLEGKNDDDGDAYVDLRPGHVVVGVGQDDDEAPEGEAVLVADWDGDRFNPYCHAARADGKVLETTINTGHEELREATQAEAEALVRGLLEKAPQMLTLMLAKPGG